MINDLNVKQEKDLFPSSINDLLCPLNEHEPEFGLCSLVNNLIIVDLPAPEGPTKATDELGLILKQMPRKTSPAPPLAPPSS